MAEKTIAESCPNGKDVPHPPIPPECSAAIQELVQRIDPMADRIRECAGLVDILDTYIFRMDSDKNEAALPLLPALGLLKQYLTETAEKCEATELKHSLMRAGVIPNGLGSLLLDSRPLPWQADLPIDCPKSDPIKTELYRCRDLAKAIITVVLEPVEQVENREKVALVLSCLEILSRSLAYLAEGFETGTFPLEVPSD